MDDACDDARIGTNGTVAEFAEHAARSIPRKNSPARPRRPA
jgi:hypothetical protein